LKHPASDRAAHNAKTPAAGKATRVFDEQRHAAVVFVYFSICRQFKPNTARVNQINKTPPFKSN
jgi:hypothetical protein